MIMSPRWHRLTASSVQKFPVSLSRIVCSFYWSTIQMTLVIQFWILMIFLPDHALARRNFMLIFAMTAVIIAQIHEVQIRYLFQPQFNVPWGQIGFTSMQWQLRRKWEIPSENSHLHDTKNCYFHFFKCYRQLNRPFYSCGLSTLAFEWMWGWRWPCFDTNLLCFVMEIVLEKY